MTLPTAPAPLPERISLRGDRVTIVPLDAEAHAPALFAETSRHPALFDYLFDEPPTSEAALRRDLKSKAASSDPLFYAILDSATGLAAGRASYLRIEPRHRVIEVGNILFSPRLQRTAAATEAMYLMAKYVFEDLGYRRYEWKCNALNQPSRRAAERLGFTFEGVFRQHMIVKGENRDTAWFAMLDHEWPARRQAFERWLAPANFDERGEQRTRLGDLQNLSS